MDFMTIPVRAWPIAFAVPIVLALVGCGGPTVGIADEGTQSTPAAEPDVVENAFGDQWNGSGGP